VLVPERALPGLQLLYHSDVAVSGGGTMNREAALLGVPTYSMFTGRKAAIDEQLASEGALVFLEHPADVDRIVWNRSEETRGRYTRSPNVMYEVADLIRSFVDRYGSGRAGSERHSRSTDPNP
jgi:predicted glycosyltransferase